MNSSQQNRSGLWAWLVTLLYSLSGLTALSYEVLWARMLSLQFGVSIFGVVVTVAAFMAGLGVGSLWGRRIARLLGNPLVILSLLELSVALFAWATPLIFQALDYSITNAASGGSLSSWYLTQGAIVFLILFLPAFALGFGFPLVLRVLKEHDVSLGVIYALNTFGGALGALFPLLLLPLFGWTVSIRLVAIIGIVVAAVLLLLSRSDRARAEPSGQQDNGTGIAWRFIIAYSGIGAAALMLQVAWTRLFGMLLLRTEYVLAVMLAVFLVGIALGSALVRRNPAAIWLAVLPVVSALCAVGTLWGLPHLAEWAEHATFASLADALWWQSLALALLTLPVTLALGAWLPLLANYHRAHGASPGAQLYGANSVGAAVGAVVCGVVLLPLLGAPGTICLAALLLFVCGTVWVERRAVWGAAIAVVLLALPVINLPAVNLLLPRTQANTQDLYLHEDAVSITHVVERADGQRLLLGDLQRMDASSDPAAVAAQMNQARLPLLLHPQPQSVLFLGIGTAISAAGSLAWPELERTGVELSQGAIDAATELFRPVNGEVMTQMRVVRDDARRFLRTDGGYYDVIIGDLFHPDLVGRSALLSVQQFERARQHLNEDGLFVQWLALNQFDHRSLSIVMRSFKRVFPHAVLFVDGFRVGLVGPKGRLGGAAALLTNLQRLNDVQRQRATGGEGAWTWLGRYWGQIEESEGAVQDEWAPQLEYDLPRLRYSGSGALPQLLAKLLQQRPGVREAAAQLELDEAQQKAFERSYVATGLAVQGWLAAIQGDTETSRRMMRFAYEANPADRWIGFDLADAMWAGLPQRLSQGRSERQALGAILKVRPDHEGALKALRRLELREGNRRAAEALLARVRAVSPLADDL